MTDLVSIGFKADTRDLKQAGREFDNLGRKGEKAERDTKRSTTGMIGSFSKTKVAALGAAAGITAVITATATLNRSRRDIMEFGQSVADLSAITGASGRDLVFYREQAKELGRTTSFSASQVVEGYKLIGSAKPDLLESAEALNEVTENALTLAEAAGIQLPEASAALGSALNQFQLEANKSAEVINILAAGAKFGAAEIPAVTEALRNAGPAANSLNVDLAETVAGIEALAISGRQGADAGTGLRQVLLRLERTADATLQPSVVGLSNALQELESRNLSNTELMKLFGDEAFTAGAALLSQADNVAKLNGQLRGTETATSQASTRMDTLQGDSLELDSALEGLSITVGEKLEPALRDAYQSLTDFINKANEAIGGQTISSLEAEIESLENRLSTSSFFGRSGDSVKSGLERQLEAAREDLRLLKAEAGDASASADLLMSLNDELDRLLDTQGLGRSGQRNSGRIAELKEQIGQLESNLYGAVQVSQVMNETVDNMDESAGEAAKSVKSLADAVKEVESIDTSSMMWDWAPVKGEFDKELNKAMKSSKQIMDDWAPKLFEEFPEEAERYTDESVDAFQTAWDRGIERVDDMFAGLWDSVFNGFEDFGSTLKRSFTGLLAELAHAAITRPISLQFQQAFSGAGMAAGTAGAGAVGGAGGIGQAGTSIVGAIQQGLSAGNDAVVQGIARLGVSIGGDFQGLSGTIGNLLIENNQLIADVLPYAGAAIQLLQGDVKGAAFTAAGTYIGSAFGPIGAAVGAALGSIVGSFFGGDDPELAGNIARYRRGGNTSQSNYGDNLGAQKGVDQLAGYVGSRIDVLLDSIESDATYNLGVVFSQRTNTRGGLFMGPHVPLGGKYNDGGFEKFAQDVMNKGFSRFIQVLDIPSEVKKLFKGVNDDEVADALLGGVSRLSQSQEEVAERFGITTLETIRMANASGLAKTEMAGLINSITDAAAGSRTLGEQLLMIRGNLEQVYGGELPQTLDEYDEALKAVDTTTKEGIRTFYQLFSLRGTFEDYRAGINELKGAVSGAVFEMLSPTEQLKQMRANTAALFEEFGLQMPRTEQDLVRIASGIDYMTEEGLNLASVFPALVDAFTRTREQADLLAGSLINASEFGNVVDFRRARALNQNGIPGFADGGYHSGGLRIVGENGPEVEATGPSRIFNQDQLINLQPLLAEIQSLRAEVNQLRSDSSDTARNTRTTADLLQRVSRDGESILTESVA